MEDKVLKAYLERRQHLGELIQKCQKLIGEYENELMDEADPGKTNQYKRKKDFLQEQVAEYQHELKLLDQEIEKFEKFEKRWSNIQFLEKLYSADLIDNNQQDFQVRDNEGSLLSRILNPFIREIENRLRSNLNYWEKSSFPIPEIYKSYTIAYFSLAWSKLDSLLNQLQVPDYERQQFILEQVLSQILQISRLINGTPQHQFATFLDAELLNNIEAIKITVRKIRFKKSSGSEIPRYLTKALNTKIASLQIALREVQKQLQNWIDEARKDALFID